MRLECAIAAGAVITALTACKTQQCITHCGPESLSIIMSYLERGLCEHAFERAKLELEYNPEDAMLHNAFGAVLLTCTPNDPEAAIARFKRAIALDSELAPAHNNLASALLQRTTPDYELACEELEEALAIDPGYLDARENLGM